MPQRALAAIQQRASKVIEGALAGLLFTAVAFQSRLVVVRTPRTDVVALTARTLEWAIFPPQRMDIGLIVPNWRISSKILTLPETVDENAR